MKYPKCLVVLCLALIASSPLAVRADAPAPAASQTAGAVTGIAMIGAPKYGPDFQHLDYVNPDAPKGGELHESAVGTFDNLNPFSLKGEPPQHLGEYLSDTLLRRVWDEPFSLYGLIAQSIEVPEDRSFIIFHINPRARFQDGSQITAEDVLFSWQIQRDKGRPNVRGFYSNVIRAEKLDDLTVKFTFKSADDGTIDREMPLIMGSMPILPKSFWQSRDIRDTMLTAPVGSGPYRVASVDPGRRIVYQRDPDYWAKDLPVNRGLYNFDRVVVDYFRDDAVALESFNAHDANFRREMDPTKWELGYSKKPGMTLEAFGHRRPEAVRAYIYNLRRPLFQNEKFRQALAYAFDFQWMNRVFFYGLYRRAESYFPNSELAATGTPQGAELALLDHYRAQLPPELFTEPYHLPSTDGSGLPGLRPNLLQAVKLLKAAGFFYRDQLLIDPATGNPVTFEILLGDKGDERITLEWVRILKRLGITPAVRTVDTAQFQSRLTGFDYDVVLFRWINSLSPGNEQRNYWGSAAADREGSRNYAGLKDLVVDDLITRLLTSKSREDFVTTVHALDRVLLWHNLSMPLYYAGSDWLAWWRPLRHPETTPLYGPVIDSWWQGTP